MASKSDRHSAASTTAAFLQHQHHVQDHVHMVEEYVLDELDLNSLQLFDIMPPARGIDRNSRHQQQRHVRRSAELRTVSIIETLSELVSRTDNGHLTEAEHVGGDCDGQCHQQQLSGAGGRVRNLQCHACPSSRNGGGGVQLSNWTACEQPNGSSATALVNGRVPSSSSTLLELSPIQQHWKTPADRAQRQRPSKSSVDLIGNRSCVHCLQGCCRDAHIVDDNDDDRDSRQWLPLAALNGGAGGPSDRVAATAAVPNSFLSDQHAPAGRRRQNQSQSQSAQNEAAKRGAAAAMCFKYSAIQNGGGGIKKKTLPSLVSAGNGVAATKVRHTELTSSNGGGMNHHHRNGGLLCADRRPMRDTKHFMMSTLRSKGRTPDWIAGIFSIARRGNLERLRHALSDMDATLIRNLSDHRGNNLFHVCCCYGHLECLQWLLQRGKQCEDAILDENKYELTPLVCAVKYGKTPCVEWLISNTIARSQLVPPTGSRPLLHWAAKYGQEVILRWLAEYMESNTMDVNVKDGYGNTSLHLAAKHGHATSIKALVTHRCDVSLKNDLGYKASDYAILYGQVACSEYLLSLEACLLMSASVASLDYDLNSAKAEINELKTQFKDVLSCAKKLVKEREELHQHLKRSEDGLAQLNKSIVTEIRALVDENVLLREKLNGSSKNHANSSDRMDETIAGLCHAMHARWQESQQRWLPVIALSEIQQKILLAEEKWKRARARVTWDEGREIREHMEVFRDKLTQVQCRATGIRLSDIRSISSSESSLASMEDTMSEYEDRYGQVSSSDPLPCSLEAVNSCNCHDHVIDERRSCAATTTSTSMKQQSANVVTSKRSMVDSSVNVSTVLSKSRKDKEQQQQVTTKCSLTSTDMNSGSSSSAQATCKVLEVIVSSNSSENNENDNDDPRSIRRRKTTKPPNNVHCKAELLECRRHIDRDDDDDDNDDTDGLDASKNNGAKGIKCNGNGTECNCKSSNAGEKEGSRWPASRDQDKNPTTTTTSRAVITQLRTKNGLLISSEPDLIVGTKCIRTVPPPPPPPPPSPPSTVSTLVPECCSVNDDADDDDDEDARREAAIVASQQQITSMEMIDSDNPFKDAEGGVLQHSFSSSSHDTSRDSAIPNDEIPLIGGGGDASSNNGIGHAAATKRRGFLQKLTLRWPSKRKVKTSKKVQEISAEDFRETYLHLRNGNGDETIYEMHDHHHHHPSDQSSSTRDLVLFDHTPSITSSAASVASAAASVAMMTADEHNVVVAAPLNVNTKRRSKSQAVINTCETDLAPVGGMSSKTMSQLDLDSTEKSAVAAVHAKLCPNNKPDGMYLRPALSCPSELPLTGKTSSMMTTTPPTMTKVTVHEQKPSTYSGSSLEHVGRNVSPTDKDHINEDEEDDDDDDDDDNKEESPPEAEQGVSFERPLSLAPEGEEDASSIHAQAHLPPKRPTSHCIKSTDHYFSRPESSASRTESYSAFRLPAGFPLRKVSSVSTDLLTPVDSMTPSRMSPAPSEVSKTESALLSPSTAESLRQLGRIEEIAGRGGGDSSSRPTLPVLRVAPSSKADIKTAHIVDMNGVDKAPSPIKSDVKEIVVVGCCLLSSKDTKKSTQLEDVMAAVVAKTSQDVTSEKTKDKTTVMKANSDVVQLNVSQKEHKAWYELSDDEEILMPETLKSRSGPIAKSSSEEDDAYFCT